MDANDHFTCRRRASKFEPSCQTWPQMVTNLYHIYSSLFYRLFLESLVQRCTLHDILHKTQPVPVLTVQNPLGFHGKLMTRTCATQLANVGIQSTDNHIPHTTLFTFYIYFNDPFLTWRDLSGFAELSPSTFFQFKSSRKSVFPISSQVASQRTRKQ